MKTLPDNVQSYRRTPEFTFTTVPQALLNEHMTKEGAWAKIQVLSGKLEYEIFDGTGERHVLTPDRPGIVEPQVPHRVEPLTEDTTFYVEFFR